MNYNLNFYPNDLNNLSNSFNPYSSYMSMNQNNLDNKLQQIQNIQNQFLNQNNTNNKNQPYYLFCGNKSDWDEFLMLNYNTTETNIFNDYKLFLQAKQELMEEQGQNKINNMKNKIKNNKFEGIDNAIKSNIKPVDVQVQQSIQQPVQQQPINQFNGQPIVNGNSNNNSLGDSNQFNNGLHKPSECKPKKFNSKK